MDINEALDYVHGLRWMSKKLGLTKTEGISDIRELKWTDIKEMGEYKAIVKIQIKTDELVTVPLCKKAMEYLPDQREDEYVFHLPLKTGLRLGLKRIIDAAGIDSPGG